MKKIVKFSFPTMLFLLACAPAGKAPLVPTAQSSQKEAPHPSTENAMTQNPSQMGQQNTPMPAPAPGIEPEPAPVAGPTPSPSPEAGPSPQPEVKPTVELLFAHQAAASMQSFFSTTTAQWDGWWTSANALTALIDYMDLSGSREYLGVIDQVYEKNKAGSFINEFYDDNAWWGLAWIRAYDISKNTKYLNAAKAIADDMYNTGWDNVCAGGIYWKRDKASKNAVENELFIKLAAALHNRIPGDTKYLDLAVKTWTWFAKSGLINAQGLVNDALTKDCKNNNDLTWSYNQGIILGALAELYLATKDMAYLTKAKDLAAASMASLSKDVGVLKERNDPGCKPCMGDERAFKGAYVRNLRELAVVAKDSAMLASLEKNAQSAWDKARSGSDMIGFRWEGPWDSSDAVRQSSALDLFNATISKKFPTNLAQGKTAKASGECAAKEAPGFAIDGSTDTKWCSFVNAATGANLDIDLGAEKMIRRLRILHAGAGGEKAEWNTKDFDIQFASAAEGPWSESIKIRGNSSSASFHSLESPKAARFVRILILNGGADLVARLYEVAVE